MHGDGGSVVSPGTRRGAGPPVVCREEAPFPAVRKRPCPSAAVLRPGCAALARRQTRRPLLPTAETAQPHSCHQCRCVPTSLCAQVPLSLHPRVPKFPTSLCPQVPLFSGPHVPTPLCAQVPVSQHPQVPESWCPHVPTSLCPHIPIPPCPCPDPFSSLGLCGQEQLPVPCMVSQSGGLGGN